MSLLINVIVVLISITSVVFMLVRRSRRLAESAEPKPTKESWGKRVSRWITTKWRRSRAGLYLWRKRNRPRIRRWKDSIPATSKHTKVVLVAYSIIVIFAWWNTTGFFWWWAIAASLCAWHFASALKPIKEESIYVLRLFGRFLYELKAGLNFIPYPMYTQSVARGNITIEFGTPDEEGRERARKAEKSGNLYITTEPIRITWGDSSSSGTSGDKNKFSENPLARSMTTDPHFIVIIRVHNLISMLKEIGELEEVIELIKGTVVRTMQQIAGTMFLAEAVTKTGEVNQQLLEKIEELVRDPHWIKRVNDDPTDWKSRNPKREPPKESWGIDVVEVGLKSFGPAHAVNTALAASSATIATGVSEAQIVERKAAADEIRLAAEGRGRAEAKRSDGKAQRDYLTDEGVGRAAAARAYGEALDGSAGAQLAARLEVVAAGLEHGKAVIVPMNMGGMTDLLSSVAAVNAAGGITTTPNPESPDSPPPKG